MNKIIEAYRKGEKVYLDLYVKDGYRKFRRVKGHIVGEYDDFILLQTARYKECLDKAAFMLREAELVKVIRVGVA